MHFSRHAVAICEQIQTLFANAIYRVNALDVRFSLVQIEIFFINYHGQRERANYRIIITLFLPFSHLFYKGA